jgi:group I intron endonuclease
MIIYQITNNITNDFYIGKTIKSIKQRFSNHKAASKRGSTTHLHRALLKYGPNNFTVTILENNILSEEFLNEREVYWIKKLLPQYNMTDGGEGGLVGYKHSNITKTKISKSHIGKYHSEEAKLKMSISSRKENLSPETLIRLKRPKRKSVCRLCDKKEMTLGNFLLWESKLIDDFNQVL